VAVGGTVAKWQKMEILSHQICRWHKKDLARKQGLFCWLRSNPPNLNPFWQIALPNGFCKKNGQPNRTNYNSQVYY
jgi:hypothetical protein